jgi:hypothetical protein
MSPDRPVGTRVLDWIAASRRRWLLLGTVLCALLPPLFSWPELPAMPGDANAAWRQYWREVVKLKVDNPWFDYTRAFPAESNQAKRNFRITVPVIAHATGLGIKAVPAVRFAFQVLLIVCLLLAAERACGDRVAALAAALAVAGTYVGTSVWMDDWGWFDNCAQALMLLALALRRPFWVGAAVIAAAFTDERALVAVPLMALFHAWTGGRRGLVWAPVAAIPCYLLARVLIGAAFRIATASAGIGTAAMILPNLRVSTLGAWSSLEGGWLLVAVACLAALRIRNRIAALFLAVACLVPVAASVLVIDFSRSASYAFPATLAALALWASQAPKGGVAVDRATLRRWTAVAAAVSLLSPNIFIMGQTFIQRNIVTHGLTGMSHTRP